MKFKSPVYTQASGSIGGLTYGHTRGVMYTRGRGIPTNPNSGSQQLARASLSSLSASWSSLSAANRNAWSDYADGTPLINSLGDPLILTGQQMFIRCNAPRLRAGQAIVSSGPGVLGVPSFTPTVLTATTGNPWSASLAFTNTDAWATEAGGFMFVQLSPAVSPGRTFYKGPFFLAVAVAGGVVPPTSPEVQVATNPDNVPPTTHLALTGQLVYARVCVSRADARLSYEQIVGDIVA